MPLSAINAFLWLAWLAYWYVSALFAGRRKYTEGHLSRLAYVIPLGAGLWLIFHSDKPYFAGWLYDSPAIGWTGTALTAAGLLFTVWARTRFGKYWSGIITLKQVHKLIRTGPYRIVRHPIYTGFLTAALSSALVVRTGDSFIGSPLIQISRLIKIPREDVVLMREFRDEYVTFKKEVAGLVPFLL